MGDDDISDHLIDYAPCCPYAVHCQYCNGYYGPSFGQHVCTTCHLFLFPEPAAHPEPSTVTPEKSEDSDSGNDEPSDPFVLAGSSSSASSTASPASPVASGSPFHRQLAVVGPAAAVDCDPLAERLQLLSEPRPNAADGQPLPEVPSPASAVDIQLLPAEVLLCIFEYVDDLTAWTVGNVCRRWRHLLMSLFSEDRWRTCTLKRFPLFSPLYTVTCWSYVFSKLIESAPCWHCLYRVSPLQRRLAEDERSLRRKRLLHERKLLRTDPPEGIRAAPLDSTLTRWQASITGPQGSPYEGGIFFLLLLIPDNYPLRPPTVRFLTRILHPNVSRHGDIGIDSVQHNWTLALSIEKVLISIQSLLTDPYCSACMEPRLGTLYMSDYPGYVRLATAWCRRYATTHHQPALPLCQRPDDAGAASYQSEQPVVATRADGGASTDATGSSAISAASRRVLHSDL